MVSQIAQFSCGLLTELRTDKALNVTILRKEVVTVYTGSRHMRDRILAEFRECIDAAQLCKCSTIDSNLVLNIGHQ